MKKHLQIIISIFCITLILLYASAVFLPHDHHGCDSECVACAVIEKSELFLSVTAICAILIDLELFDKALINAVTSPNPQIKNTPVKLRVKLSD